MWSTGLPPLCPSPSAATPACCAIELAPADVHAAFEDMSNVEGITKQIQFQSNAACCNVDPRCLSRVQCNSMQLSPDR